VAGNSAGQRVGLTCQHPNQPLLVAGLEVLIRLMRTRGLKRRRWKKWISHRSGTDPTIGQALHQLLNLGDNLADGGEVRRRQRTADGNDERLRPGEQGDLASLLTAWRPMLSIAIGCPFTDSWYRPSNTLLAKASCSPM
jgi:hypothetical protein